MAQNGKATGAELPKTPGAHILPCVWVPDTELQDLMLAQLSIGSALVSLVLPLLPFLPFGIEIFTMPHYMWRICHLLRIVLGLMVKFALSLRGFQVRPQNDAAGNVDTLEALGDELKASLHYELFPCPWGQGRIWNASHRLTRAAWTPGEELLLVEVAETLGNGAELKEASPWEYKFEERIALVPLSLTLFVATMM